MQLRLPVKFIEYCTVNRWMKLSGQYIQRGEIIAEVGIESVICDIPSPVNGTIVEILAPEHVVVPTDQALCTIQEDAT